MAHREMAKRQAAAAQKYKEQKRQEQPPNVLMTSSDLTEAARIATNGGTKPFTGLYMPNGARIQAHQDDELVQANTRVQNASAQKNMALSKVARAYDTKSDKRIRKAHREKKTHVQIDDEESERKTRDMYAKTTEHDMMMYKDLFNFFDVDKDRTWGSIEFAQRMTDIGHRTSIEDASNLLYFAGVRDVDRITYNDFLQMMPKLKAYRRLLEQSTMEAFQQRDNGSGFLSRKQLREMLFEIAGDDGIDKARVDMLVKKADREKTGRIPFEFVIRAMFGSPPITEYKRPIRSTNFLLRLLGCGSKSGPQPGVWDDDPEDLK